MDDFSYNSNQVKSIELLTPEGVNISFKLATITDRWLAFSIDVGIVLALFFIITIIALLFSDKSIATSFYLLLIFLIRNFYFIYFEQRYLGSSPGKRMLNLRVIDEKVQALTMESIIIRNITREAELFFPISIFFIPKQIWPAAPMVVLLIAGLWPILFILAFLINNKNKRIGDMIAGTLVVYAPKMKLMKDIITTPSPGRGSENITYYFRPEQLQKYGEYELQTLESILRKSFEDNTNALLAKISTQIKNKIQWPGTILDNKAFLTAFYTAQRDYLERKLLLGNRKKTKND